VPVLSAFSTADTNSENIHWIIYKNRISGPKTY